MAKTFKKRKEWGESNWGGEPINTKNLLKIMAICVIPIFGQIYFLFALIECLRERETYFDEVSHFQHTHNCGFSKDRKSIKK